jgi:hypothetical protein
MHRTRTPWAGAFALALLAVAVAPTFADETGKADDPAKPADAAPTEGVGTGDLAPAWKGKTFINSQELTLAGLRGKFVFIEYFGTG